MSFRISVLCLASTLLLSAGAAHAAAIPTQVEATKTLGIGDPAPPLSIQKWLKGAPVASFEKGKVYMVEFWATWCGPCIATMPHLTELQKKHKDKGFTVISVTSADTRGNTLERVEDMVKDKGDKMGYTIAWDDERKTSDAWMRAAGQGGIPCSFLVDGTGHVVYIGHPARIDATLDLVLAGKHDLKAMAEAAKRAKEIEARALALQQDLNRTMGAKDFAAAVKVCDDLLALDGEKFIGAAAAKFQILASYAEDLDAAYAWGAQILGGVCKDSDDILNGIAWWIVDPASKYARRDTALALRMAQRAVEITKGEDAACLQTLARAWFAQGDVAKAIEEQRKAVALDARLKPALDEYEAAAAGKRPN